MSYLYTNIKTIGTYGQHQGYISYSTSQTDDDYTVTISEVGELFSSTSPYSSTYSTSGTSTITASIGSTSRSGSKNGLSANVSSSHSVYLAFNNFNTLTVPITKSNSQQTVTVSISWNWSNIHLTNSVTLTIPAKQSAPVTYTISYNANGGTNAPTAQTYTGSPITITTNKPSRNGYTFVKWNTKANGTGVSYNSGQSNVSLTANMVLYAQWAPIYVPSQFKSQTAYRCDSSGNRDNEGTYGYVYVGWTVGQYGGNALSPTVTVSYYESGQSQITPINTLTTTGNSKEGVFGNGNLNIEKQYTIEFKIVDTYGNSTNTIVYKTFISTGSCIMDINEDGTAIGLLSYVSDNDTGVFVKGTPLYAWTEIGSGSNSTNAIQFTSATTNFNEIMIVADINRSSTHHLLTVSIPSVRLSDSGAQIKLGGGEGNSTTVNCGAWGTITTSSFTPIVASINNESFTTNTAWYIYGR